jgi:putative oxidoreductase
MEPARAFFAILLFKSEFPMKIVALVCRILLGLMFVVFGANILHPFMPPQPLPPADSLPGHFFAAFGTSGWIKVVGLFQLLGGILVLIGGTAPLGLSFLAPVLVNILCFHLMLTGGAGIAPGLVVTILWLVVLYAYRANFAGIFTTKATPTA